MTTLQFLEHWEPLWLFLILGIETIIGAVTLYWIVREYNYDKQKDDMRKQRKTRTTKKTTTSASGQSTVEESTEVVEPIETIGKEEQK